MRKKIRQTGQLIWILAVSCVLFCGCQKENKEKGSVVTPCHTLDDVRKEAVQLETQYDNMDFSEADIIIPEGDSIEELIFPVDVNITGSGDTYKKIKNNFYENIRNLTGKKNVREKYVYYKLPLDDEPVNIKDVSEEDRKRSGDSQSGDMNQGFYLSYNDSTCSMLLYGSSFMLEIADNKVAEDSSRGYDWLGHRPTEGMVVKSFDIPEDSTENVRYSVDGKMLKLQDAITYVEENMGKGYHYVRSPFLTYRVYHVDVIKLEENSFYYQMKVRAMYEGVSFSYEQNAAVLPLGDQDVDYDNFSVSHQAVVMSENSIDYIWSSAHSYEDKNDGETYDKFISIKDAMDILSSMVSAATKLKCDSVELMYRTEFHYDESGKAVKEVQCHPVYQFKFSDTGLPEYPVLYFNVDAVTGFVEATKS